MATILCVDNDPLTPQILKAQLAEESIDYGVAVATGISEAIAQVDEIAVTGPEVPLVIASQSLIDAAWLQALYDQFPQALLLLLLESEEVGPIAALIPPGQFYRCIAKPWQSLDLRLTIAEALRRYRHEQQLAHMQAALAAAQGQIDQLSDRNRQLEDLIANRSRPAAAQQSSESQTQAMLSAVPDMARRRQLEAQIREGEQRLQLTLAFTGVGTWSWFPTTGTYQWAGPMETLLEIPAGQDNMYQQWRDRIHPDDVDRVEAAIQTALALGQAFSEEYRYYLLDGSIGWRWVKGQGCYGETGELDYVLGVVQDITTQKQSEAALKASEQNRQLALELTHTGSWEFDVASGQVLWSDSHYQLLGLTPGEQPTTYETWRRAVHPDDVERADRAVAHALATGTPLDMEYRVVLPNGAERWVLSRGHGVYDDQGQPLKMLGVMVDIGDRKTAELALQASETRFRQIAETVCEGFFVFDVAASRYEYLNPAYLTITGLTPEHDLDSYYWLDHVHPDDREAMTRANQQEREGQVLDHEYRIIRLDGELRWLHCQSFPIFDGSGQMVRLLGTVADITDRKRTEQALEQAEERYRRATQAANAGVWELNIQTGQGYLDPSIKALAGYGATEISDDLDSWLVLIHPDDKDQLAEAIQTYIAGSTTGAGAIAPGVATEFVAEYRLLHRDGSMVWVLSRGQLNRNEQGQPTVFFGTTTDITQLKQAELALQQLNNELEQRVQQRTQELQKLAAIVENSTDFMGTASLSGEAIYINQAGRQLIGLSADEAIDQPIIEFHNPATVARLIQEAVPTALSEGYWRGDSTLRHRQTGEDIVVEQAIFLVRDPHSHAPLCMATVCRDMRERVRLEADRHQAEQALRASETLFRQLAETIQEVFWMTTANPYGQVLYVSPAFEQVWGLSCEALYQSPSVWIDSIHPDDRQRVLSALDTTATLPYGETYRIFRADGELRWIQDRAFPVLDEAGNVCRLAGVARDITNRKRAEVALQESRNMLQLVLDTIPQRVFWKDRESRYLGGNLAFARDLSLTPDRIVGQTDTELGYVNATRYRHEDAQIISSQTHRLGYEEPLSTPHGTDIWTRTSKVPLTNPDGEVIGVLGCYEDISDRKRAEQALQESRNMLRLVLDTIPQRVFWKDRDSRFLGCNSAFAQDYQLTPEQIIGKTDAELPWAAHAQDYRATDVEIITTQRPKLGYEELTVSITGETIWIRTSKIPLTNADGEVIGVLGCYDDISDRKLAEEALKTLNQELEQRVQDRTQALQQATEIAQSASQSKSMFLANMSHELRTPLNAILGFSQLLARDFALGSDNRQSIDIINRSGEHLLALINGILEMAKIEAGQVSLNLLSFDLTTLLGTLADLFYLRARDKGVEFVVDCHPLLPCHLRSDEPKLRQVLINLVGNAIKFTPRGQVCLKVTPAQQPHPTGWTAGERLAVTFTVQDTGIGIAADHLDHLFEPFMQVNQGAGVREGTGLGLSISHQFVQLLGGNLAVESQPGLGSTFWFTIPMQVASGVELSEPVLRPAQITRLAPGQASPRILVVDDDAIHRQLLTQLLSSVGFEVCDASNGQRAIALWESWHPQLIWLDMRMPILGGYEVTQYIRRQEQTADLPPTKIIALTANAFEEDRAQAIASGCDDFVRKPFQLGQVLAKLAEHLDVHYSSNPEAAVPAAFITEAEAIAALRTVPTALFAEIYDATLKLDREQLIELITQLAPDQGPLAELLRRHIDNFAFDTIHDLLQQAS